MGIVFALLSSLTWGTSDFFGGLATRARSAAAVTGWSQGCAFVVVSVAALLVRPEVSGWSWLVYAASAGLCGVAGLLCFYTALAQGTMGVVSPIASMGALVPVGIGLAMGERPGAVTWLGVVVALVGVVLASGPELSGAVSPRPVLLAVASALFFGFTLFLLNRGAQASPLLTVWGMRAASVTLFVGAALVLRSVGGVGTREVPGLAAIGVGDLAANFFFGTASRIAGDSLAVVTVLGSLYPVMTILLARAILGERLRRVQQAGVLLALVGAAVISLRP
mgnify:FL=1